MAEVERDGARAACARAPARGRVTRKCSRRVACLRSRWGPARCEPLGRAALPRTRHVPRLQRRLRPPHHHLLARGPPLPSRWVFGPGNAAAELPRHGQGLPTPPLPLPAERGCGRLGKPPPSLAASGERGGSVALPVAGESRFPRCAGRSLEQLPSRSCRRGGLGKGPSREIRKA